MSSPPDPCAKFDDASGQPDVGVMLDDAAQLVACVFRLLPMIEHPIGTALRNEVNSALDHLNQARDWHKFANKWLAKP